jgi:four helix bundle protein
MAARSVEDLEVFKLAHALVLKVYEVSRAFPREETFGLVTQLRRAATSVVANLVEGSRGQEG